MQLYLVLSVAHTQTLVTVPCSSATPAQLTALRGGRRRGRSEPWAHQCLALFYFTSSRSLALPVLLSRCVLSTCAGHSWLIVAHSSSSCSALTSSAAHLTSLPPVDLLTSAYRWSTLHLRGRLVARPTLPSLASIPPSSLSRAPAPSACGRPLVVWEHLCPLSRSRLLCAANGHTAYRSEWQKGAPL